MSEKMSEKPTETPFLQDTRLLQGTRRDFLKRSALAALVAAGMGPLSLIGLGRTRAAIADAADGADGDLSKAKALAGGWRIPYQSRLDPINQVPYISTHYIEPKVMVGKDAVIDYYVTDYDQREYMFDDPSATFTVEYWVNGAKSTIKDVKAGDNTLTVKTPPKGEVLFALQATDSKGRKSHRLFHEFLVVDPKEEAIPADKVLAPDLKRFNIYNDDTHPVETTKGLTEMLEWAAENGYRKVVMPKGRYRIDADSAVMMVSGLTLDLNGSTFKSNPNLRDKVTMLDMVGCIDSHVVNGTFEGDLKERDFENSPKNTEWVNAVHIGRGSKYCSYQDIKVIDVVGRGTNTSFSGVGVGPGGLSYTASRIKKTGDFEPGDIDEQGNSIDSTARLSTKEMVDISSFHEAQGFFQMGLYLGYQGNPTGSWVYKAHFYDADEKYLETIEGYMYRRLYPPKAAKFARFTVVPRPERAEKIQSLMLFDFLMPYNCTFRNVHHENNRCIGMTPSGFVNMLVEGCTFVNCGWAAAKCAFDAEDGWDMAQDLMFRNNVFGENPRNEFVCISGHNFVVENNVMGAFLRNRYFTLRNNKLKSARFEFGDRRSSGSPRVYGNTIEGNTRLTTKGKFEAPYRQFFIRDNILKGDVTTPSPKAGEVVSLFYKCKIQGGDSEGKRIGGRFAQCDFQDIREIKSGSSFEIYESTIDNCLLKTTSHGASNIAVVDSNIANSQIEPTRGGVVLLQSNTMRNCTGIGKTADHEWVLRDNKIVTSLEHLIGIENYYKQITLEGNSITSTNPNFSAVLLSGLIRTEETTVAITNNTFDSRGGLALNATSRPAGKRTLTVYLSQNKLNGIKEISENIADIESVKIVRKAP